MSEQLCVETKEVVSINIPETDQYASYNITLEMADISNRVYLLVANEASSSINNSRINVNIELLADEEDDEDYEITEFEFYITGTYAKHVELSFTIFGSYYYFDGNAKASSYLFGSDSTADYTFQEVGKYYIRKNRFHSHGNLVSFVLGDRYG